jgi:hypothetical protein
MGKQTTIKLYDGPSLIDGKRIIVLMTGLGRSSKNTKTGKMLQTWILRYDIAPHEAIKTGDDSSVCGGCPLRPSLFKKGEVSKRSCYVKVYQAPLSTWKANRDLPVTGPEEARTLIGDGIVRRGSYGDPGAVPMHVWDSIPKTRKDTGYTHQWKENDTVSGLVMASVHSLEERKQAKTKGFRTFRTLDHTGQLVAGEILCPASKEAGHKTTCQSCGLCTGKINGQDNRKDIAIVAH